MKLSGLVLVVGCSSPSHSLPGDAAKLSDAAPDGAIDAPADAPHAAFSPSCTTTPAMLLDSSPRIIGNMARAGDTLYVSAYQRDDNGTASDFALYTIDLTTGMVPAPVAIPTNVAVWPGGADVYANDHVADGTIWQLHPGATPLALVDHVSNVTTVTADDAYVYWADSTNAVSRRSITSGPVEAVMTCPGASRLLVDGTNIYCAAGTYVIRGLAAGGSIPEPISTTTTGYPIGSMMQAGTSVYYVDFDVFPALFEIETAGSSATVISKSPTVGRYSGLAIAGDSFYLADTNAGLRRFDRTTTALQTIVPGTGIELDPVVWNHDLFYLAPNPQLSGERYVMHCVD